jgi:hypothetical protein
MSVCVVVKGREGYRPNGGTKSLVTVQDVTILLLDEWRLSSSAGDPAAREGPRCSNRMYCNASQRVIVVDASHPFAWYNQVWLDQRQLCSIQTQAQGLVDHCRRIMVVCPVVRDSARLDAQPLRESSGVAKELLVLY